MNICRAAEATKEQVKLLQAGSVTVSSTIAVHVVNNNASGTAIRDNNTDCRCCGKKHPPKSCPAHGKTCSTCGKPNHFASVCRSGQGTSKPDNKPNRRRIGPSKQRYKSETLSVSSLTDSTEDVFVGALYVNIDTVSEEKTSWCKTLSINNTELNCKLDTGAQANVMSLASFNNLEIPATLRNTEIVLTAYDNKRIKPVGVTTLLLNIRTLLITRNFLLWIIRLQLYWGYLHVFSWILFVV